MEDQPTLKPEREPREYLLADLQKDVREWIQGSAVSEDRERIRSLPFARQFIIYQNNFWTMVQSVCRYINDDGSINEDVIIRENASERNSLKREDPKWVEYIQWYERIVDSNHSREIYKACDKLGYNPKQMFVLKSPLNDEQIEMLIDIWIEMRRLGFERIDLIG